MSEIFTKPYKSCGMCKADWCSMRNFIQDPKLLLNGYFADFEDPDEGLIMVTHECGSTLGVKAGPLKQYYTGPVYPERKTGTGECEGRCLNDDDFEPCAAHCSMQWIREILQLFKSHKLPF